MLSNEYIIHGFILNALCIYTIKMETFNNNNDIIVYENNNSISIPNLKVLSAAGKCHVC